MSAKPKRQLIAFDMDGTLLNSQKELTPGVLEGIRRACEAGKDVVMATGRAYAEVAQYRQTLPQVHYGILESGGVLYDFWEQRILDRRSIAQETILQILTEVRREKLFALLMCGGKVYTEHREIPNLACYGLAHFTGLFSKTSESVEDIVQFLREGRAAVEKINLYHAEEAGRDRTRARLLHLPLERVDSEPISLELTALGVTKGDGLTRLAALLHIPIEQTIAVGDADNDLTMIRAAGLGLAMGNANDAVKAAAGAVVADCDHDGCREAIETYLLG